VRPALLVIAGPNGAGKTTITDRLRAEHWSEVVEYLNPDEIALEKIVSRYSKSMANLAVAMRLADRVYVYDNSVDGSEAELLARTSEGQLRKVYGPLPQWIADAVDSLPRHPDFINARDQH
jgi:predicted ABC-type ATPase